MDRVFRVVGIPWNQKIPHVYTLSHCLPEIHPRLLLWFAVCEPRSGNAETYYDGEARKSGCYFLTDFRFLCFVKEFSAVIDDDIRSLLVYVWLVSGRPITDQQFVDNHDNILWHLGSDRVLDRFQQLWIGSARNHYRMWHFFLTFFLHGFIQQPPADCGILCNARLRAGKK